MSVWNMIKIKRNIEMYMMLTNLWLVVGSALVTVLCMVSSIYYSENGTSLSMIQVFQLLQSNPASIDTEQFQLIVILQRIPSGYLSLFAPIVTSLPFVLSFHAEKVTKYKRVYMFRKKSSMDYYINKWIAGIFAGGAILMFGILLFQFLICFCNGVIFDEFGQPKLIMDKNLWVYFKYYTGIFIYGAMSSMLAIAICFLCDNLYFIICLPFVLTYLYNIGISYLLSRLYASNSSMPEALAQIVENMFSFSYMHIFYDIGSAVVLITRILVVFGGVYGGLVVYNKSKLDCGE